MGIELEVGKYESDIIPPVVDIDPDEEHLYLKTDGSITGLEIVTHPMTLAWARDWQSGQRVTTDADCLPVPVGDSLGGFNGLLAGLRDNGCEVNSGYGLHIHVSRNAFRSGPRPTHRIINGERVPWATKQSPTHQMAWLLFLMRNSDHIDHPTQLARRDCSEWGSFGTMNHGELKRKAYDRPTSDDRYVAINTNNDRTYELRFFAATLDQTQFWAALEFADASVEYTRNMRAKDILRGNALSWEAFTAWVMEHDYPHLASELQRIQSRYAAIAEEKRIAREREAERMRDRAERLQRERERYQAEVHQQRADYIANGNRDNYYHEPRCGWSDCTICYPEYTSTIELTCPF
jgi:hypothetical protein